MADGVSMTDDPKTLVFRFNALGSAVRPFAFDAGAPYRAAAARDLGLAALEGFRGEGEVRAFQQGAEVSARFEARLVQTCGVTLEPIESRIEGAFRVRVAPVPSADGDWSAREVVIDPFEEDPPDLVDADHVDVGGLLLEHLSLEIDPFPRKPDAVFTPPPQPPLVSPFAVLKRSDD